MHADQHQVQAQAGLAAAYRQIVGPAAEYREKLNQIIQLERQGAITAQQRANAIRGMQREMAAHNAKQQGGLRGAVSEIASSQFGAVAGPAAAAAAAVTVGREIIDLGDQYTSLTNKIKASTESEAEAIRIRERLFKTANDARVRYAVTASDGQHIALRIAVLMRGHQRHKHQPGIKQNLHRAVDRTKVFDGYVIEAVKPHRRQTKGRAAQMGMGHGMTPRKRNRPPRGGAEDIRG